MIGIFVTPWQKKRKAGQSGKPDTFPPVLANLVIDAAAQSFSLNSTEAGTLHWVLDNVSTYADAAALVAAKPSGEVSGSVAAVAGENLGNVDITGIAAGDWRLHVGVIDDAGNASTVSSGDFTIVFGDLELNGDPLEWNGDQLIFNAA